MESVLRLGLENYSALQPSSLPTVYLSSLGSLCAKGKRYIFRKQWCKSGAVATWGSRHL